MVGNKEVRSHDGHWPDPGAKFAHKVGVGPLAVKDETVAMEAEPFRRLVLRVRALPVGVGTVTFEVDPLRSGAATRVRMTETIDSGPARLLGPVGDLLVKLRNAETLRRLKRLAEKRRHASPA